MPDELVRKQDFKQYVHLNIKKSENATISIIHARRFRMKLFHPY